MDVCKNCDELVKYHREHPSLHVLSDHQGQVICKCGFCQAFLMLEAGIWEIMIGSPNFKAEKSHEAAKQLSTKKSFSHKLDSVKKLDAVASRFL